MAEVVGVSKQAMSMTVVRLEALGYVSRRVDPSDRRANLVVLTKRGRDALRQSAAILSELAVEYAAAVGERELATTVEALRTLRADTAAFDGLERWFSGP